jgi:uncharacterized membrane protein (DUF485 family)
MFPSAFSSVLSLRSRNLYVSAVALTIMFAALLATSLPGRDLSVAVLHAFVNFKVMWVCALVAVWRIGSASSQDLRAGDVIFGGSFVTLAAVMAGLWSWIILIAFAAVFLQRTRGRGDRQALYLLIAIGFHEIFVAVCGEVFAEGLLNVDALIAGSLTRLLLPEILVTGSMLHVPGGHSVMLVWGCSSLSYVGDMMLLCWAASMLLAGNDAPVRALGQRLALVAVVTVTLNSVRLALMAADPHMYEFFHDGPGATAFRITILAGAVSVAWLRWNHANS